MPKRAGKSSKRTQLWICTPHFSKFRAFRMLHPLKSMCFWSFHYRIRFHFLKRALCTGTARSKWLKKVLLHLFERWPSQCHVVVAGHPGIGFNNCEENIFEGCNAGRNKHTTVIMYFFPHSFLFDERYLVLWN